MIDIYRIVGSLFKQGFIYELQSHFPWLPGTSQTTYGR
ncbi:MAG: hypothetical protein ACI9T7_000142 [Oleiphilaceae bacterium]|jgi:hypothetical protein